MSLECHVDESLNLSVSSPQAEALKGAVLAAMQDAMADRSAISPPILGMNGMSGRRYRHFVNNLIRNLPDPAYLEVGSWQGSTLCSAINGNRVRATAIDNWSLFGGPKAAFLANLQRYRTADANVDFIESDFRQVDFSALGIFDIYLFDGPHELTDQYDGVVLAQPALAPAHVLIVDDWNWVPVREGTFTAIARLGLRVEYCISLRTTLNNRLPEIKHAASEWHNGYFVAVLSK